VLLRDVLNHAVKLYPEKRAIVDGGVSYTYGQSAGRIRRLASALLALGIRPGENIAILANNSHRYFETYFVADFAGTPLAPLNTRLAAHELQFILNDAEVTALVLGPEFIPLYEQFKGGVPGLKHVILLEGEHEGCLQYESLIASHEPLAESVREWDENEMVTLSYTGGTTGLPKGVMLTQRNVVSNAQHFALMCQFGENDVWLHVAPMFHLADAWACYAVTLNGGTHVFVPGFTPQGTLEAIQQHRITKTILVPTMINFVVNFPAVESYDTSSINTLLYGASPMAIDRLLAAVKVFGPKLMQAYGMTETAPLATLMQAQWMNTKGPKPKCGDSRAAAARCPASKCV
jgi:long-chain acyl-CoA synthetase